MWQLKYASAVPKNLGVGVDFRPCSEGNSLTIASVVRGQPNKVVFSFKGVRKSKNSRFFSCCSQQPINTDVEPGLAGWSLLSQVLVN